MHTCTVCHVIFEHYVFDARVYFKEMLSLARAGYRVILLAPRVSENTWGMKREDIRSLPDRFRHAGIEFRTYGYSRFLPKWNGIRMKHCLENLMAAIRDIRADIYHIHEDGLPLQAAALLKDAVPDAKLVFDFHEFFTHAYRSVPQKRWHKGKGSLERYLRQENAMMEKVDLLITSSDFISDYYRTITRKPVVTVMNCQSGTVFPDSCRQPDPEHFLVVHEGRMLFNRGFRLILEMARAVTDKRVRFLILGDMAKKEQQLFERFTAGHGIADRFIYTGRLPYWDVPAVLGRAHLGLCFLLSRNARTGIALKFFNYLRYGIPVVSLPHPIIDGIINETGCGTVCPGPDPHEIAALIDRLAGDPAEVGRMGAGAAAAFASRYNWEAMEQRLLQAYAALAGGEHA